MISFSISGPDVCISIQTGIGDRTIFLVYKCESELFAILLKNQLEKEQSDKIEAFAKENYNKGWKDKASKKVAKRIWFPSWLKYKY